MKESTLIVHITFPDLVSARETVETLVNERLAACGSLVPNVESIYRWQGRVETAAEVLAIVKTQKSAFAALESRVRMLHRYEVPECIAVSVQDGSAPYLAWVAECIGPAGEQDS
jgi:periplasmic divalent cation tolerance protein